MTVKDLKVAWLAIMLCMLTMTAPEWLNPDSRHLSQYSAPWVYPGLQPDSTEKN